jgi:hypothetical protein
MAWFPGSATARGEILMIESMARFRNRKIPDRLLTGRMGVRGKP